MSEELRQGLEYGVVVWPFDRAPEEFRKASPHGGDEDWVVAVRDADGVERFLAAVAVATALSAQWSSDEVSIRRSQWQWVHWAGWGWRVWYVAHA